MKNEKNTKVTLQSKSWQLHILLEKVKAMNMYTFWDLNDEEELSNYDFFSKNSCLERNNNICFYDPSNSIFFNIIYIAIEKI